MLSPLNEDRLQEARWLIGGALAAERTVLDESESKLLAHIYGILVPLGSVVEDEDDAQDTAQTVGYPVAMKAVGPQFQHKTDAGLVVLNVRDDELARTTFRQLKEMAGAQFQGVLVEQMIQSDREFMVGMKRDRAFGPVVAFGLGGVLTEALQDLALAVAPVDDADAAELPNLIKAKRLLGPFRGLPVVDRTALTKVILAIGQMAIDHPEIAEIDVNPLLVAAGRPVAADALVILSAKPAPEPERSTFAPSLKTLVAPQSIAVVGASDDISKWGGSALRSILDGGYRGKIYPVNPRGGEFFGLPVYAGIGELPEAPDMALLAVGSHQIVPMLGECGRKGVPAAIAIAAGFSETGETGAEAEREIARVATENNVTLMGPNCMGMLSNEVSLHAIGFIVTHPDKGRLSLASQSGNIGVQILKACERRGIGLEKFLSLGNEAQIGVVDAIEYLRGDPNTACIMAYVEGIDEGRRFLEVAKRTTAVKPVVVLRGGLTESGSKAAASHTGAMAGSAVVWEAVARQSGVVTCAGAQEVLDLGLALAHLPLPRGRRVGVLTNGGGVGVLMADALERCGMKLATLPPSLFEIADELLPPFYSRRNPLDMVASAGGAVAPQILKAAAQCDSVDAIVVLSVLGVANAGDDARAMTPEGSYTYFSRWETAFMELAAELMETTGKPIINVPDNPVGPSILNAGGRYASIVLPNPASAALVLDRLAWYGEYRRVRGQKMYRSLGYGGLGQTR